MARVHDHGRTAPTVLGRLLRGEATLRQHRSSLGVVIAVLVVALAIADVRLWPNISFAPGYALPIVLAAYAYGIGAGVGLSILCVVLRVACAGRTYGPWWLFAGSALILGEYLMLALGVGLLGRAVRRVQNHTQALRRVSELARGLTTSLERDAVLRRGVQASVRLTGADGGFVVAATSAGWEAAAVFQGDRWRAGRWMCWPPGTVFGSVPAATELRGETMLAVPIPGPEPRPQLALVVYRAKPRPFEEPKRALLELFALHVSAALTAADLYATALQATGDKARMLAHVAHELAAPLHVVLGTTDLLGTHADPLAQACLERLRRQTHLLMEMTTNLLEFSRLEVIAPRVRREPVHLPELYEQVRELAEPLIGEKNVRLELRVEAGAEWVESDPGKLRQILTNLATNAVKYTPHGRVELSAARENGRVTLAVRDTGVGIPLSERERVFEPFYRGGSEGPRTAGVGLGLALAQELAAMLGTRIALESEEREGATFSLVLPGRADAEQMEEPNAGEGEQIRDGHS